MQAAGEFRVERLVDQPLAGDSALAVEGRRDDLDLEMGLAAFAPAGMTVMTRRFVLNGEPRWRETRAELAVNSHRDGAHLLCPSTCPAKPQNSYCSDEQTARQSSAGDGEPAIAPARVRVAGLPSGGRIPCAARPRPARPVSLVLPGPCPRI